VRRARIALVAPFRMSFGTETGRELLYLRVVGDEDAGGADGWGEWAQPRVRTIETPEDVESLRRFDRAADGLAIVGFTRAGAYCLA